MKWPYRLIAPGPVPVPPLVMRAMSGPVLHHRTPAFEKILLETWSGLKDVFGTKQPVMILTGSGTAGMEAAVANVISQGDTVLVVVSGKFGERWADMCERFGARVVRYKVEWGFPVALQDFRAQLKKSPGLKAVFTEACETSTATLHPVREMAREARAAHPEALFCVDAITAVGCMEMPMDSWDLDVVVGGSQKAFMIPPGLAFVALSERAWAAQKKSRAPKYYLDLAGERKANEKGENHFTIPTPLVIGLHAVLTRLREVGLSHVSKRCEVLAEATRTTGEAMDLSVFSQGPSPSVTALNVADSAKVRDWLERERNITVMGGQDHLKGKILRVGHMGDVRDSDMVALFEALSEHLQRPFDRPALEGALKKTSPLFPEA
jgi:aspartate aminotransferase-like enzyme